MLTTDLSQDELDYLLEVPDYPNESIDIEESPELMRQGWVPVLWRKHRCPDVCAEAGCLLMVHYNEHTSTFYYKHMFLETDLVRHSMSIAWEYIKGTPTPHEPLLVIDPEKASRIVWITEEDTLALLKWMEDCHSVYPTTE